MQILSTFDSAQKGYEFPQAIPKFAHFALLYISSILQHLATKLCNFTNPKALFLAVVIWSFCLPKFSLNVESFITFASLRSARNLRSLLSRYYLDVRITVKVFQFASVAIAVFGREVSIRHVLRAYTIIIRANEVCERVDDAFGVEKIRAFLAKIIHYVVHTKAGRHFPSKP